MNKCMCAVVGFGIGAGIGSGISWYLTKKKYVKQNEENIQSVKDSYDRQEFIIRKEPEKKEPDKKKENDILLKAEQAKSKPDVSSFRKQIEDLKNEIEKPIEEVDVSSGTTEVITAAEYNDADDLYSEFEKITLNYWTNGILTEENGQRVDISSSVGYDCLEQLDNEDIIYVRNKRLKIDYDIQKMDGAYTE